MDRNSSLIKPMAQQKIKHCPPPPAVKMFGYANGRIEITEKSHQDKLKPV